MRLSAPTLELVGWGWGRSHTLLWVHSLIRHLSGWRKWLQSSQKGSIIMLDSISRNSSAVHAGNLEDRVMEFVVDNKESLANRCARGHTK